MEKINNNISSRAWILLAVSDMQRARNFYEKVMEQEIDSVSGDLHVVYKSGIALQYDYAGLVAGGKAFAPHPTGAKLTMKTKPNNFQIAFEVEDLDYWSAKIKAVEGIEIIHDVAEYHWGQRAIRFYDFDGHIIEFGEDLKIVVKRFLEQGLTVEKVAELFGDSVENIKQLLVSH